MSITFMSFSFGAACVAVTFETSIVGGTSKAVTIVPAAARWACETFAFEFTAARAGEALTLESTAFWAAFVAFTLVPTTFGRTDKTFAIIATPWWWTIEAAALEPATFGTTGETAIIATAAFEAWAHRWTWRPAPLESCVSFRATRSATFESRTVRTSRSAGPPHMLTDGLGHLHEFVFAEFAVAIFVELREHLGWVRRLWTAATCGTASACGAALAGLFAFMSASHFAHFLARFGAFCIV
jgi:hypothetical protein